MKIIAIFLFFVVVGCSTTKNVIEYDYYYFSPTAYKFKQKMIDSGVKPSPNHTTVNGQEFTCSCPPAFIEKSYLPNYPDTKLVMKLPKGSGKVLIHF